MIFDISKLEAAKAAQLTALIKQAGSQKLEEAMEAQTAIAAELQTPLRAGVIEGSTIGGIFNPTKFDPNARVEYPIDFYRNDNAGEFRAFVVPNQGRIPEFSVDSDYVTVPTYDIAASIDFLIRYAQEARWDIVGRALEVLETMFVKKLNDDGWHLLLAAAYDRGILVNDDNAAAGQFTKRLVSLLKLVMRRNGGGNSASINRAKLTDLFVSPESLEDVRNWGVDQVDDFTRREIFTYTDDGAMSIYGVKVHELDELGEGQEYQDYYQNTTAVGASNNGMAATDKEIVIGLDLSKRDSFVMPIREEIQIFADPALHRSRRAGFYGWGSQGLAALNNTRILLGSC